ncbi:MAG: hypothetical protein WCT48_07185 [Candidatus Paceibacterota bacterium]
MRNIPKIFIAVTLIVAGFACFAQDNFPWTTQDGWKGKTVKVAVILAELSDVKHASAPKTEQPCKLIDPRPYPNGHDKTYYDDMLYCVKDYYRENSYGTVNIEYIVFPTWYKLRKPTSQYIGKEGQFVQDAIAKSGLDVSGFDVVAAVHSGDSKQIKEDASKLTTETWNNRHQPISFPPYALIVAENEPMGAITHEIGHLLGEVSPFHTIVADLNMIGNMNLENYGSNTNQFGAWDLMGMGAYNHLNGTAIGTSPSNMGSYTKEFLGWLTPDVHKKSEYHTYTLTPLELQTFGDKTLHYNLSEAMTTNTGIYYQIEARKKDTSKTWSATNPSDSAVILYRVNTYDYDPYGYGQYPATTSPNSYHRYVNVRKVLGVNDTFIDFANLVKFTYASVGAAPTYSSVVDINQMASWDVPAQRIGMVLSMKEAFQDWWWRSMHNLLPCLWGDGSCYIAPDFKTVAMNKTLGLELGVPLLLIIFIVLLILIFKRHFLENFPRKVRIMVKTILAILLFGLIVWFSIAAWFLGNGKIRLKIFNGIDSPKFDFFLDSPMLPSLANTPLPDLDLHAITQDGRHIGMNYSTAKFENQIAGSEVSGDIQGDEEWIFVPSTEIVRYYVSSHDTQAFFEANPDIASQVPDKTDKYELYARTIDPATGIFTGATTTQTILPGIADFYQITGTTTPSVIQTDANAKDLISLFRSLASSVSMPKTLRQILLSETNIVEKLLAKNLKKPALALIQSEKRMIQMFVCKTKKTDLFAGMQSEKNAMNLLVKDGVDKTDIIGMSGLFAQFGRSQKCGLAQSDAEILLGVLNKLEGVIKG